MKIAITGATGFIGGKLVAHYQALGADVHVLTRRTDRPCQHGAISHCLDLATAGYEEFYSFLEGADIVYHCAAEIGNPAVMRQVNVDGTDKLLKAAAGRIGRWVQLSSVGAYGVQREGIVNEQTALNPLGVYEISKVESDALVAKAALAGSFEYSILRPSNVYGTQMRNRSLFALMGIINRGLFFFIGAPGMKANYIHVDNVIAALLLCATHPQASGQTYNLSDQRSMEQFVATIAEALQVPVPTLRLPEGPMRLCAQAFGRIPRFPLTAARVAALTVKSTYSYEKIQRELGYRHEISMEDGIRQLVEYWLKHHG